MNKLIEDIFKAWLWNNHFWFMLTTVIIGCIILLSIVTSCILAIWFSWWWKLLVASIGALILFKFLHRIVIGYYVEEFKNS